MTNMGKYDQIFIKIFSVKVAQLNSNLVYESISDWDSIGHMELIAALEDEFDIMMDTEDIIDFSSYDKGIEILKKYEIELY